MRYDGGAKNYAVHFDLCWQWIPHAGTTQAATLGRLVGIVWGPIRSNQSNWVKASAAYVMKTMHFNIYCFSNALLMKHNASIVESCKRDLG